MSQAELFSAPAPALERGGWEPVAGSDRTIWLRRAFLDAPAATALYERLRETIAWRQDTLSMFGQTHPIPRLHQWYGPRDYTWSGITMAARAWPPELDALRREVEAATGRRFDAALANYYRDGDDTVGWHADDEPELGPAPFIASLSLGAERDFVLRRRPEHADAGRAPTRISIALPHGSLLAMVEGVQAAWLHSLPRRKRVRAGRINLTFRPTRAVP